LLAKARRCTPTQVLEAVKRLPSEGHQTIFGVLNSFETAAKQAVTLFEMPVVAAPATVAATRETPPWAGSTCQG